MPSRAVASFGSRGRYAHHGALKLCSRDSVNRESSRWAPPRVVQQENWDPEEQEVKPACSDLKTPLLFMSQIQSSKP